MPKEAGWQDTLERWYYLALRFQKWFSREKDHTKTVTEKQEINVRKVLPLYAFSPRKWLIEVQKKSLCVPTFLYFQCYDLLPQKTVPLFTNLAEQQENSASTESAKRSLKEEKIVN